MPFRSERQRRYIYMEASQGVPWARKFIRDSGKPEPKIVKRRRKRVRRAGVE